MKDNELIAEFMGHSVDGFEYENRMVHRKDKGAISVNLLAYDKSWDWLMPVVERISNIVIKGNPPFNSDQYPRTEIVPSGYIKIENLRSTPISKNVSIEGSLILATYKAVVEFIKWYNEQPKS